MTRIATYARVSTDMQAEEGKSIAAQQAEMREFAQARGWEIVADFVDPGYSGTELDRPGLNALRTAAHEHAFDILLVHELSRLSRRIFDTFRIFEELGRLGIGFASVKEPDFDFSTPTGRLFLTILAALNQYYVDLLKMHTAKGKRERAREGLYNASITPYGYRHTGDADTPPVVVEGEAKAVQEMFRRYATGRYSYAEIADWLNDAGYRPRSGRRWSKDTVADMLRNPFYKGYVIYRQGSRDQSAGEIYPGKHEPIVNPEMWEMCRRVREQRRTAPRTYQPKYRVYLLNSIAACDLCGRKLRAQGAEAGRYYRDVSNQRGFVDCPAAGRGVRTEVIERQVGAVFRQLRLPPDWQARLEELMEAEDVRETLKSRRARLLAERRRLLEGYVRGDFEGAEDVYQRELARLNRELAELPASDGLEAIERAARTIEVLSEVWDTADEADRRDLLRLALREVKVDVMQGRLATVEPYPVFVPLFRQIPLLQEVSFGVFVPIWPPGVAEEIVAVPILPPLTEAGSPEDGPDWPLVVAMPEEMVGERVTPVLSEWLKEQRKQGRKVRKVVEIVRRGVPSLKVDPRKWPEVSVESVGRLEELGAEEVPFLWTPFAFQRAGEREELMEQVRRVLEPGGTWALVDVLPASMPAHWLFRFFPQAWENELARTWDGSQMYGLLMEGGFAVQLRQRSFYQPVRLGVALEMARMREACPQLQVVPDEAYEAGLAQMERAVETEGEDAMVGSEFCLVEVVAERK